MIKVTKIRALDGFKLELRVHGTVACLIAPPLLRRTGQW